MDKQSYIQYIETKYTDKQSFNNINILLSKVNSEISTAKIEEKGIFKKDHKKGLEL